MVAHIADELTALAAACTVVQHDPVSEWSIDSWSLDDDCLALAVSAYRTLLYPSAIERIVSELDVDGVAVEEIFLESDEVGSERTNTITRADMIELVAAASMVAADDMPLDTLVMPNVPKRSRKQSDSGIDILAMKFSFGEDGQRNGLDRLFVGSVKHTVADASDLRSKLASSVADKELTKTYLLRQLRVFHGQLQDRGIDASAVFGVLRFDPVLDPSCVRIVAHAALDDSMESEFFACLGSLYASTPGLRHLRAILVPNISILHEAIQ